LKKTLLKKTDTEVGALQFRLQYIINNKQDKDLDLKVLAIKAFQSFVRSYATHTRETRHIFDIKNLHLGHLSKTFCLVDTPATFGKTLAKKKQEEMKKEKQKPLKSHYNDASEFADGIF